MRKRIVIGFCLIGVLILSLLFNYGFSLRLEMIRPHLVPGATESDLVNALGQWDAELGPDDAGNNRRLTYGLNGKYKGKVLELRLRDDKLVSAVVLGPDANGRYTVVLDEVLKPAE